MKIKKFNDIDLIKDIKINESKKLDELKKSAENIGLDLTKNMSKRIELI